MRIGGLIVAAFFITLHSASCTHDERGMLENLKRTINTSRFDRAVNVNLYGLSHQAAEHNGGLRNRSLFNFIPSENLTDVPVTAWVTLCEYFDEDIGYISKVLNTLTDHRRRMDFLTHIRFAANYDRNHLVLLQTVSRDLIEASANEENALNLLVRNRLLLLSAPSYFLLKLKNIYQVWLVAYASVSADKTDSFWRQQSPLTKRTWSKILLEPQNSLVVSLIKQQKMFGFFQVLDAINLVELRDLLTTLDDDQTIDATFLHSIDWNTVQIRTIVNFPFKRIVSWLTADFYRNSLSRLLPVQIARIGCEIGTAHLQTVDQVLLPQALQLFQLMRSDEKLPTPSPLKIDESNCALVAKLLYSQTNSFFAQLYNETLKMKIVKCLDSDKYSLLQARYILGRDGLRDVNDYLFNLKGLMAAIPASFYINLVKTWKRRDGSLENHFTHVLKNFPLRANRVAASAALHACKTAIGDLKCIESVLENGNHELISMISPLDIWQNRKTIWNWLRIKVQSDREFERRIVNWPTFVLTQLLRDEELVITRDQLFNETRPIRSIILGLNCEILSRISSLNFLPVFELYNRQRTLYTKEFPKDLQRCAQRVFLDYLRMKSNTRVKSPETDFLQFLDLADIRSIGGYVLATFPPSSIVRSKYYRDIVEEIGRLSLPELMLAVTRRRLISIASQYVSRTVRAGRNEDKVLTEHLITLGNLTHFLDDRFVRRIDPAAVQLLLEAEFIDTRICASSAIRKAWADKLIETFDSPETWDENTFLKIGDMLIVMEESSFDVMNVTACSRVADLIKSAYKRHVEWIPRRLPFHEVCSVILPQHERLSYESSVKRLALFYAASIEQLLDTVADAIVEDGSNAGDGGRSADRLQNDASPIRNVVDVDSTTASDFAASDFAASETEKHATIEPPVSITSTPQITERTVSGFITSSTVIWTDYSATESDKPADNVPGIGESSTRSTVAVAVTNTNTNTETTGKTDAVVTSNIGVRLQENQSHVSADDTTTGGSTAQTVAPSWPTTEAVSTMKTNVDDQTDNVTRSATVSDYISSSFAFDSVPETNAQTSAVTVPVGSDLQNVSVAPAPATSTADTSTRTAATANTDDDEKATTSSSSPPPSPYTAVFTYRANTNSVSATRDTSNVASLANDIVTATTPRRKHDDVSRSSSSTPLPFEEQNQSLGVTFAPIDSQELIDIVDLIASDPSLNAAVNDVVRIKSRSKRDAERKSDNDRLPSVGCNTLKMLDTMSDFILNSRRVKFEQDHVLDCIELLAQLDNLSVERKKTIWSDVESKLTDENLTFVAGKVLSAIETAVLHNFTYDSRSPGALELIGAVSSVYSLKDGGRRLVNKILRDNYSNRDNRNINTNELKKNLPLPVFTHALGKMICDVPNPVFFDLLKRNDMSADIWTMSRAFDDCPMECLSRIANVTVKVYGDPFQWEPAVFTMLGPVVAAIPGIHEYSNITRHFSASAFQCLRFSSYFVNANRSHYQYKQYLEEISLTSAMLLLEEDCLQADLCSFASSLAAVELAEDSITSRANISRSFGLSLFILILKIVYAVPRN